jgi:hypothetical protein
VAVQAATESGGSQGDSSAARVSGAVGSNASVAHGCWIVLCSVSGTLRKLSVGALTSTIGAPTLTVTVALTVCALETLV